MLSFLGLIRLSKKQFSRTIFSWNDSLIYINLNQLECLLRYSSVTERGLSDSWEVQSTLVNVDIHSFSIKNAFLYFKLHISRYFGSLTVDFFFCFGISGIFWHLRGIHCVTLMLPTHYFVALLLYWWPDDGGKQIESREINTTVRNTPALAHRC